MFLSQIYLEYIIRPLDRQQYSKLQSAIYGYLFLTYYSNEKIVRLRIGYYKSFLIFKAALEV